MRTTDRTAGPTAVPARPSTASGERRPLTPAAERALAEAAARRADVDRRTAERPKEFHGRSGLDPARYGDWEVKGICSDF